MAGQPVQVRRVTGIALAEHAVVRGPPRMRGHAVALCGGIDRAEPDAGPHGVADTLGRRIGQVQHLAQRRPRPATRRTVF